MVININCDLGEKSMLHSNKHDPDLLEIVNSANIACGYHAGDDQSMNQVVEISKKNGVSIGAHPSFNDLENFGRKKMNLSSNEVRKIILDQYEEFPNSYQKKYFFWNGKKIMFYIMNKWFIKKPPESYINTIKEGYKNCNINPNYANKF